MAAESIEIGKDLTIDAQYLGQVLAEIAKQGYELVGPTVREGAIVYDHLNSVDDLPRGWTDEQSPGKYRLNQRTDRAFFGYTLGPHSWKKFLHPAVHCLWKARRNGNGFQIFHDNGEPGKYAFIGVRACELHAIFALDKVFAGGIYVDPEYKARRQAVFIVAANCTQAGGNCFCVSMKTGPKVASGYDLALTEVLEGANHYFVVAVGSQRGAEVMAAVPHRDAGEKEHETVDRILAETSRHMGRTLDTNGMKELLYRNYESSCWDSIAKRCMTCANCTMVCPTCFCTTVEDTTDLSGDQADRCRSWDSCFAMDFSYIHGGSVRMTSKSRYRQWMTHKLAAWVDQFGESGCVGCGRCITWCPAGIDITEEARAIRESEPVAVGARWKRGGS
jgi:sulfhydrogenase subunit beta (sulfur reductase)